MADLLRGIGITVVAVESDNAIIAFKDDADLQSFRREVDRYAVGPRVNPRTGQRYQSTSADVLEYIEAAQMRLWGQADRVGKRLANLIGAEGDGIELRRKYTVDIELWHRGTQALAANGMRELRTLIEQNATADDRLHDSFTGEQLCLARASMRGSKLRLMLNLDIVAEVELPPTPVFDARAAQRATARQFPIPARPAPDGPRVCVVDSGISARHPLLVNHVGHATAIQAGAVSAADGHGHGTMVGGLAVFGDIRACFQAGDFQSPITLYSARVLNDQNRFDDERLIIHQMRDAILAFTRAPYGCRVFNISLGADSAWLRDNDHQSIWAECLDVLARELHVLLVVSAGNQGLGWGDSTRDAEAVLRDYPAYLFEEDCGLCEPATAAIALTVGGITERDQPEVPPPAREGDLIQAIAGPMEPTPTTRIGPGLNGGIKPEFVAHAGNLTFEGAGSARSTRANRGVAVMSLSHRPVQTPFTFDVGTSFAAPQVARIASLVWKSLSDYLGEDPHPNLVRAVLASAANVPNPLRDLIEPLRGKAGVRQVCGYGMIDEDLALNSGDRRATLVAQDQVLIDAFRIYEVPAPDEFRQTPGSKKVIVALAYDPPVRRRRADYLGVKMSATLIRGKTLAEVVDAYRAVTDTEREAVALGQATLQGAFQAPFKCNLQPGVTSLASSTLQRSEWTFTQREHYGATWYLVVRAQRTWAPAEITHQDFAVAVTLEASEPELYNLIQQRIRVRQQQRARTRG